MRPLVSTAGLASLLDGSCPPVLIDVRWRLGGPPGREEYAAGHLPGAAYVDLDADLAGPPGADGRHPMPDPGHLQNVLRRAGVRQDRPVVVYDADNGSIAARAWWLLRWAGHSDVAVLDGGFAAWAAEGRPTETSDTRDARDAGETSGGTGAGEPGDFTVRPGHMPVLDADGAAEMASSGVLLDARAPERYRGEVEPIDPRAGHIPGALNAPFSAHTGPDGRWRAPADLAEHFAAIGAGGSAAAGVGTAVDVGTAGVGTAADVGTAEVGAAGAGTAAGVGAYCGSGVTAASVVLALEVAGVTDAQRPAALYVGSWSNWSADPDRPVATG